MLQLRQAVLEQGVLRVDQLCTSVGALLEFDWRGLILKAGHLEGLHNDLIGSAICMRLAVCVEADYLHWPGLVPTFQLDLVLDGYLCARSQLFDTITS